MIFSVLRVILLIEITKGVFTVHIISFANQKGGVGKTTSAVNIASILGTLGKSVLLIDLDPQGSATSGVGIQKKAIKYSSYDVIVGKCNIKEAIIQTTFKNLSVLPATMSLAGAELEIAFQDKRESYLKDILNELRYEFIYDYVIIDCPPSLGMITINALVASSGLVIPIQCEYFALEGLTQLMMTIKAIKARYNPNLIITGILVTMFNARQRLSSQVLSELEKYYSTLVFDQKISRAVALGEAPSFGEPIFYYSKYSKGSLEYQSVAKEIILRTEGIL